MRKIYSKHHAFHAFFECLDVLSVSAPFDTAYNTLLITGTGSKPLSGIAYTNTYPDSGFTARFVV